MKISNARPVVSATIELNAGQDYRVWIGRGAMLIIQSGSVQVHEAPNWVGETMLNFHAILHEGQHYQVERGGWTCLRAIRPAEICYDAVVPVRDFSSVAIASRLTMLIIFDRLRRLAVLLKVQR